MGCANSAEVDGGYDIPVSLDEPAPSTHAKPPTRSLAVSSDASSVSDIDRISDDGRECDEPSPIEHRRRIERLCSKRLLRDDDSCDADVAPDVAATPRTLAAKSSEARILKWRRTVVLSDDPDCGDEGRAETIASDAGTPNWLLHSEVNSHASGTFSSAVSAAGRSDGDCRHPCCVPAEAGSVQASPTPCSL